jgi:hypothetical protein
VNLEQVKQRFPYRVGLVDEKCTAANYGKLPDVLPGAQAIAFARGGTPVVSQVTCGELALETLGKASFRLSARLR